MGQSKEKKGAISALKEEAAHVRNTPAKPILTFAHTCGKWLILDIFHKAIHFCLVVWIDLFFPFQYN